MDTQLTVSTQQFTSHAALPMEATAWHTAFEELRKGYWLGCFKVILLYIVVKVKALFADVYADL
jgi:hypothetical protein